MEVLASESKGFYSSPVAYVEDKDGKHVNIRKIKLKEDRSRFLASFIFTLRSIFLPYGFPGSVSKDYVSYQIFDTIQAFCSSLTGALATEAVMKGVGVGDDAATPLAAAVTWLLKSGTGMVGQIVFTWYHGTRLDSDCKKWRFFADVVNDGATFIDLLSPTFPPQFRVAVFCLSSVARSLVGVAGGATRAAITQHQARSNNMADVAAKDGSQETLVNLVALLTSLVMLPAVSGKIALVWTLYMTFTAFHLLANFLALKALNFEALNEARLLHCLEEFVRKNQVPSIQEANSSESVFVGCGLRDTHVSKGGYRIRMGSSLSNLISGEDASSVADFKELLKGRGNKKYLLCVNQKRKTVFVALQEDISGWETVEAYSLAVFMTYDQEQEQSGPETSMKKWNAFEKQLIQAGYATDRCSIYCGEWRAKWDADLKKSS